MTPAGHILDASTIALYRLDESNADPRTTGPLDSTGTRWTIPSGGSLLAPYTPIYGQFARAMRQAVSGGVLQRTAVAGDQAKCIGSWTVEAFVRIDALTITDIVFSFAGATSPDLELNNILVAARVETSGRMSTFHETNAGVNTTTIATAGTVTAGTWYHLAWVKDSGAKTYSFYINGVIQGAAVAYASETTGGTAGVWVIGRDSSDSSTSTKSDMTIRAISFAPVVRNAAWLLANAALLSTTAALITDGSTYFSVDCNEHCATDLTGNAHHLCSVSTVADTRLVYPTDAGLIIDGGRAKYLDTCNLSPLAHSAAILAALLAGPFTVEAWVLLSPLRTDAWGIFTHGDPGVDTAINNYWSIQIEVDGTITVDIEHGAGVNGAIIQSAAGAVKSGARTHIAVRTTVAAAVVTVDIFVNGVQVKTGTGVAFDGATSAGAKPWHQIGRGANAPENDYVGFMDDVRLSSIARSNAEILESYNRGVGDTYNDGVADGLRLGIGAERSMGQDGEGEARLDGTRLVIVPADTIAPTITIVSPTPGVAPGQPGGFSSDWAVARITPVVVDVDGGDLRYTCIVVRYPVDGEPDGEPVEQVVHRRGAFRAGFNIAGASEQVTAKKLRLTVLPNEGWPSFEAIAAIDFDVDAIAGGAISDQAASS